MGTQLLVVILIAVAVPMIIVPAALTRLMQRDVEFVQPIEIGPVAPINRGVALAPTDEVLDPLKVLERMTGEAPPSNWPDERNNMLTHWRRDDREYLVQILKDTGVTETEANEVLDHFKQQSGALPQKETIISLIPSGMKLATCSEDVTCVLATHMYPHESQQTSDEGSLPEQLVIRGQTECSVCRALTVHLSTIN